MANPSNPHQFGRVVYVEPNNDINGTGKGTNFTHNPEDYSILVDLQVDVVDRFAYNGSGSKEAIEFTMEWDAKGTKTSMFKGTNGMLTTRAMDTTFSDIVNDYNQEAIGINSIEIHYNSWNYPEITIQFTDIRGATLLSSADYVHTSLAGNENKAKYADNFANCFFSTFFRFPYPRYTLIVKGFYGRPVSYTLCVNDFKTKFNSSTGNFDVTVSFIGYMYGILTDIPMRLLFAAPHSEYEGKKYWEHNRDETKKFVYADSENGTPMKRFTELSDEIKEIKDKLSELPEVKQATDEAKEVEGRKAQLDEINSLYAGFKKQFENPKKPKFAILEKSFSEVSSDDGTETLRQKYLIIFKGGNKTRKCDECNGTGSLGTQSTYVGSSVTGGVSYTQVPKTCPACEGTGEIKTDVEEVEVTPSLKESLYSKIFEYNGKPENGGRSITYIDRIDTKENAEKLLLGSILYEKDPDDKTTGIKSLIGNDTRNSNAFQDVEAEDYSEICDFLTNDCMGTVQQLNSEVVGVCILKVGDFENSLNAQLLSINSELERAFDKVKDAENNVYEQLLGFRVNIKNIIDMCLAHLDTFMHCMYTCMDEIKRENRLFSDSNLAPNESDVKTTVTKDTENNYKVYLPPFFAFRKENPKTKQLEDAWIGDDRRFSDENKFREIQLINGFLNGMLQNELERKEKAKKAIENKTADEYGLVVGENYRPMFVNDYYQKVNPYDKLSFETYEPLVAMFAFRCLLGLVYCTDYPDINTRFDVSNKNKREYFEILGGADAENFSLSKNFETFKQNELSHGSFDKLTWEDFKSYITGSAKNNIVSGEGQQMFFAGDNNAIFKTTSVSGISGFVASYGRGDKIAVPLNYESPEDAVDIVNRIVSGTKETNGFGVSRSVAMPVVSVNEDDKDYRQDANVINELFCDSGIGKKGVDKIGFYFRDENVWGRYVSGTSSKFWTWDIRDVVNKWDSDYWFPSVVLTEDVKNVEAAEKRSDGYTYRGNLYNAENIGEGTTIYAYEPTEDVSTIKAFFLGGNWWQRTFGSGKDTKVNNSTTSDSYIDKKVVPVISEGNAPDTFMLLGFPCAEGTLFEHEFFVQQTSRLAKAFLFLHSLPMAEISAIGEVVSSIVKKTYTPSISDIPFVSALFIGALYWRDQHNDEINYTNYKPAGPRDLITYGIDKNGNKITRPLNPVRLTDSDERRVTYLTTYDPNIEAKIAELEGRGSSNRFDRKLRDYLDGDEKKNALFCGFWDVEDTVKQRFIQLFTDWANGSEFGYFLEEFSCGKTVEQIKTIRTVIDKKVFTGQGLKCKANRNAGDYGITPGTTYNDYMKNTFDTKFFRNHMKMGASKDDISLITALRPNAEAVIRLSTLMCRGCVVKVAFPRALMSRDVFGTGWTQEANSLIISDDVMKAAWDAFHDGIMAKVGEKQEDDESDESKVRNITPPSVTPEEKLSLYLTLKNIHDKWLIATKKEKYMFSNGPQENKDGHKSIADNFFFINSYYEYVGNEINLNIEELPKQLDKVLTDINEASSLYSFMYDVADQARMQLLALPIFNAMADPDYVKSIFTPMPYDKIDIKNLDTETQYVFMYPEEASKNLNLPSDGRNEEDRYKFEDDSFMFVTESGLENVGEVPNTFWDTSNPKNSNVPVIGVTFAKQNQSIFKDINVSMDSPKTTEVSIYNTVAIADRFNAGNTQITALGQDLFPIYSNYSYECTVTMMGCACIMPLMYFQLNNIPMFKGSYIIYNVSHSISPGNMTTTFTGQRLSRFRKKRNENALAAFPNENALNSIEQSIEEAVNKLIAECYTVSGHKLENEYVYDKVARISGINDKAALRAVEYAETHYGGGFFSDGKLRVYYDPWMAKSSGVTYASITDTQFGTSYVTHDTYAGNMADVAKANEQLTVPSSTTIVGAFGLPSQAYAQYGAASMQQFYDECAVGFNNQAIYFANLLASNNALKDALDSKNWGLFAKLYKGSGGVTTSGVYMSGDNATFDNYAHDLEVGYNEASGACSDYADRYEGPTAVYEPASQQFGLPEVPEPVPEPDPSHPAHTLNVQKAVSYALSHAHTSSTGKCATYVKKALEAGGIPYVSCDASDCKQENFIRDDCYKLCDSQPGNYGTRGNTFNNQMQRGDIVIIDSFNAHKYGHIAIWTGSNWVSDFKQNNCDIYKDGKQAWEAGKFHFYRFKNRTNV